MTWTAHRAAFMARGAFARVLRQCPDISWILRAGKSEGARLSAFRAAFMKRRDGHTLCSKRGLQ